ncbi:MAG TPA: DUF1572 family protein [Vicinamibacterales bacterium]|nr:DUF1572 family protein [Vicinamibacterales bacterium]
MTLDEHYIGVTTAEFRRLKKLAEDAIAQVQDRELAARLDPESNSIFTVMKHMAGNLRSRFTDFLTTDGEKPDRNRDAEFEDEGARERSAMLADWESGWRTLFASLAALQPSDLLRDVYIRGERHSVVQALNRALTHQAYHVGQIVFLAKHFRSEEWKTLSLPRKRS